MLHLTVTGRADPASAAPFRDRLLANSSRSSRSLGSRAALILLPVLFLFLSTSSGIGVAADWSVGQTIVLHAKKPVGVPVHQRPAPSFLRHVPDGTTAIVERIDPATGWLRIRLADGEHVWVSPRYVRDVASARDRPHNDTTAHRQEGSIPSAAAVWDSPDACRQAIEAGARHPRSEDRIRVATWNVRWFPIGHPPEEPSDDRTDLEWMACVLVWMQPDLLAVQESLGTSQADAAWDRLVRILETNTGGNWRWIRPQCGDPDGHHLLFLWNDSRVAMSDVRVLWPLNAKARHAGEACAAGLRPGLYAYVRSRRPHGVDFHLVTVHLKSGPTVDALDLRHRALNRIDQVTPPLLAQDGDIVILGDFNTMGAGDRRSQRYELKSLRRLVAKERPGFDDLPIVPRCTQYFRGRGGWLDHVLVSRTMREVSSRTAHVSGYCEQFQCRPIEGPYPLAYRRLSDHCPVWIDLLDRDDD